MFRVQTCRFGAADLFTTPMFGVDSCRVKETVGGQVEAEADALQSSRVTVWFIQRGSQATGGEVYQLHPETFHPRLAAALTLSLSLHHFPSAPFSTTDPH